MVKVKGLRTECAIAVI